MYHPERRRDARLLIRRPAKVRNELTGKYLPARTLNVSAGGAVLVTDPPARLLPGQRVRVGISTVPSQGLIEAQAMQPATVLRCTANGDRQHVAVAFDQRQTLRAAA